MCASRLDNRGQRAALTIGHRADGLGLSHADVSQELGTALGTPAPLGQQQFTDGHRCRLPRAFEDDRSDRGATFGDRALELGARQADLVGSLKRLHVLWHRLAQRIGGVATKSVLHCGCGVIPRPSFRFSGYWRAWRHVHLNVVG